MEKRKSISEQIVKFQELDKSVDSIDAKLDELLRLLESSDLDSETATNIRIKINQTIDQSKLSAESLKLFRQLDNSDRSRLELADNLENLLSKYKVDSKVSKKFIVAEKAMSVVQLVAAVAMIGLGFAMISFLTAPSFKKYTIFYYTADNSLTLIDIISLLIVFAGVYLFITSVVKMNRVE